MRAMSRRPNPAAMSFLDHPRVYIPTPKSAGLDMLRAERFQETYRSLYVFSVSFGFDAASLVFIERPVTVELKSAVGDPRSGHRSGGDRIGRRNQRSYRRALIADRRYPE